MHPVDFIGELPHQPQIAVPQQLLDLPLVGKTQGGPQIAVQAGIDLPHKGQILRRQRRQPQQFRRHANGIEGGGKADGPRQSYFIPHAVQSAPVAEQAHVQLALPPLGNIGRHCANQVDMLPHQGLIFGGSPVNHRPGPFLVDGRRLPPVIGQNFGNAGLHRRLVIVILKGRLHRKGMGAGIFVQGAADVDRGQVAAERHRTGADDGIEGNAQPPLQFIQAEQAHFQRQLRPDDAVVQRRVAARQKYPLRRQIPPLQVFLDNPVAVKKVFQILNQGNDPQLLGEKLPHPILDQLPVQQRPGFLPHNHPPVIGFHQGQLLGRSGKGQDDFLNGGVAAIPAAIKAVGHIPGGRNALQGFDHRLPHIPLNAGIGDAQGQDNLLPQAVFLPEKVRVAGQQLADHLIVGFLALGIPHLLGAA